MANATTGSRVGKTPGMLRIHCSQDRMLVVQPVGHKKKRGPDPAFFCTARGGLEFVAQAQADHMGVPVVEF